MAAKTIPFVASTALGERLFAGVQKVLAAAKAPVSLVQTDAKFAPADAKYLLAEPLSAAATGELANKYGLSSKVTSGAASQFYPNSIYPSLNVEVVQNLYALSNPAFSSLSATTTKAVTVKDESAIKLAELQKETERNISSFFRDEANKSVQATLRLACDKAIKTKADKKTVMVVTKPHGDAFDDLLAQVTKSESDGRADELRNSSVSVEPTLVGNAWPKLVMFPEGVNVVVCGPNASGDQVAQLFVGIAGGTGMVAQQLVGDAVVFTSANAEDNENPTGALLAASNLLTALGHEAEAKKIAAAVAKAYTTDRILPKELPGGKADLEAFIDAVAKHASA
uniref:ATPTB3 n=1 Tax=Euglena gracilis TaxID=3039 RepID=UPI0012B67DE7|nr:Chain B, ATPTB3 [Euglena gracilis]6TDU_b Chain b, ATPTB3 [Euglena gracilis]6TDV_B Chain B, ATPTB3 [Euglena gracilis]6TDV_b Chain b, ATPTB3 [Euglena gracilis]6TDW_B Chain B, ATPTB3 [Euglena gracilis]|eukprot:EG_transcript_14428